MEEVEAPIDVLETEEEKKIKIVKQNSLLGSVLFLWTMQICLSVLVLLEVL